jgi:hypothetical protein
MAHEPNQLAGAHPVAVSSQEQATEHRCLGSPTVQINGLDIEPAARVSMNFGLG